MLRGPFSGRCALPAGRTPLHDDTVGPLSAEIHATAGWTLLGGTSEIPRPGGPPEPWTIVAETPTGRRVTIGSRERWEALRAADRTAPAA